MQDYFDHEKLEVYQEAILFVAWWAEISQRGAAPASIKEQIDRASASIALNIAEGNGKYSFRDRCRYLQIARGSTLECAAGLDVLLARRCLSREEAGVGKHRLLRIVAMLVRLITSLTNRVAEGGVEYEVDTVLDSL
jgi:four helix bundle protein